MEDEQTDYNFLNALRELLGLDDLPKERATHKAHAPAKRREATRALCVRVEHAIYAKLQRLAAKRTLDGGGRTTLADVLAELIEQAS